MQAPRERLWFGRSYRDWKRVFKQVRLKIYGPGAICLVGESEMEGRWASEFLSLLGMAGMPTHQSHHTGCAVHIILPSVASQGQWQIKFLNSTFVTGKSFYYRVLTLQSLSNENRNYFWPKMSYDSVRSRGREVVSQRTEHLDTNYLLQGTAL